MRVFGSKSDLMIYQIQQLGLEIEYVKMNATKVETAGKNVSAVLAELNDAQVFLDNSRDSIGSQNLDSATDLMINANDLIKKAEYDLSIAPAKSADISIDSSVVIIMVPVAAVIIISFYFMTSRRRMSVKYVSKVMGSITEKPGEMETKLSELSSSLGLLEEEFKQNVISKESHDEIKAGYEKKISELKEAIERKKSSRSFS